MKTYKFRYDGKGINDATNEYAPRIATISSDYNLDETLCNILEQSPEMLRMLESILYSIKSGQGADNHEKQIENLLKNIRG